VVTIGLRKGWVAVEFEIEHIESVVTKVISLILCGDFKDEESQKVKEFLSSECLRVRAVFRRTVLRPRDKAFFTEYFGVHQVALVELMDKIVIARAELSESTNQYSSLMEFLLRLNDNLLSLIKDEFFAFFLEGINAPKCIVEQAHDDLSENTQALEMIRENQYVEYELIDPLLSFFHHCLHNADGILTFRQLNYLKLLQAEVLKIDFSIDDANWRRLNLCNTLIKLNFNHPQFFKFYTDHISRALLNCETLSDRIDQAAYFYKIIGQVTVVNGVGLYDFTLDIRQQLLEWITCELD
jgi:hypothetical protein